MTPRAGQLPLGQACVARSSSITRGWPRNAVSAAVSSTTTATTESRARSAGHVDRHPAGGGTDGDRDVEDRHGGRGGELPRPPGDLEQPQLQGHRAAAEGQAPQDHQARGRRRPDVDGEQHEQGHRDGGRDQLDPPARVAAHEPAGQDVPCHAGHAVGEQDPRQVGLGDSGHGLQDRADEGERGELPDRHECGHEEHQPASAYRHRQASRSLVPPAGPCRQSRDQEADGEGDDRGHDADRHRTCAPADLVAEVRCRGHAEDGGRGDAAEHDRRRKRHPGVRHQARSRFRQPVPRTRPPRSRS